MSSYPVNDADVKHLQMIEYISEGVYLIELVSKNGDKLRTISRVSAIDIGNDEKLEGINFDSDEFGRQERQGIIYLKPIFEAIISFHKAQKYRL